MRFNANRTRDPFRFSLRGRAAINPYVIVPTVPDHKINEAWDARLQRTAPLAVPDEQTGSTRGLEDLLARYFAPGRQAA
ncbi:hypothetical protein [Lentisalinibacter sediminis]|uniref:hypothetical protein n=1 Tax=Lentisalinibacter sediminis TaxID=2992237 RepID=UPI0038644568